MEIEQFNHVMNTIWWHIDFRKDFSDSLSPKWTFLFLTLLFGTWGRARIGTRTWAYQFTICSENKFL